MYRENIDKYEEIDQNLSKATKEKQERERKKREEQQQRDLQGRPNRSQRD